MRYSFHNSGTVYFFNPIKPAYDVRDGVKRNALEFHTMLVNEADRLDVFISDDRGHIIVKSSKPTTHKPVDWKKVIKRLK